MNPPTETPDPSSGRIPPRERFAADAIQFDLKLAAEQLDGEVENSPSGHRQIALYKHDKATIALFRFEEGAVMKAHKARGTVFVQVVEGSLSLGVEGANHMLDAGGMLVLAPGVQHDVKAHQRSLMLLTVCLEN